MRNLLPERNRKLVQQEYYFRLSIVAMFFLAAVLAIAAASLLPAYFIARTQTVALKTQTELVETSLARRNANTAIASVGLVNAELAELTKKETELNVGSLLRDTLAAKPSGVSLITIRFKEERDRTILTVEGVASTRDTLLSYRRSLEAEDSFTKVELPISDLAKTRDIGFSMTLSVLEM